MAAKPHTDSESVQNGSKVAAETHTLPEAPRPPTRMWVSLPDNMRGAVDAYADSVGLSRSSVIRIAVANFFGLNRAE